MKRCVKNGESTDDDASFTDDDTSFTDDVVSTVRDVDLIQSVFTGDFFNFTHTPRKIKPGVIKTLEQIKSTFFHDKIPSILEILESDYDLETKKTLLEKVYDLRQSEPLSAEYKKALEETNTILQKSDLERKFELEVLPYKARVLNSDMSEENMSIAYRKVQVMDSYENSDPGEYVKYKTWVDSLLKVPFGNWVKEIPDISDVKRSLNSSLSFLEKPKDQFLRFVAQMKSNPGCNVNSIGLCGPKGIGKTAISKALATSLNRPFRMISLGGESDNASLTGHNFTYVGSNPGRLVEILKETKVMNPVVLVDECFPYEQKVMTEYGLMEIGEIVTCFKRGNALRVRSFNQREATFEYQPVVNVTSKKTKVLLELNIDGAITRCTENHPFLTTKGYKMAKDLAPADRIVGDKDPFGHHNAAAAELAKKSLELDVPCRVFNRYDELKLISKTVIERDCQVYDIKVFTNRNFVIYNDGLNIVVHNCDKISETPQGKEIIGTLIHLTDTSTNGQFTSDKYFSGITFDLSKVLFVFTYNDAKKLDPILADRLTKINLKDYTFNEKLDILQRHVLPDTRVEFNLDLQFETEALKLVLVQNDSGMRSAKSRIHEIFSKVNILVIAPETVTLDYKKLAGYFTNNKTVLAEHIPYLLETKAPDTFESMYV